MTDLTLQLLVLRLAAYVFIATVHGFTVAAVAVAMGDQGPRHDGRLRLNPLVHLDLVGTASGVLFSVGWIRPLAVDPLALQAGRAGPVIVVVAGAAATLASAMVLHVVRPFVLPMLPDTVSATVFALIEITGELSVWFAVLNLLPLPPLTGVHLLSAAAPAYGKVLTKIAPYAGPVLAAAAWSGIISRVLAPACEMLARLLLGR